jgi:hypothetical protein
MVMNDRQMQHRKATRGVFAVLLDHPHTSIRRLWPHVRAHWIEIGLDPSQHNLKRCIENLERRGDIVEDERHLWCVSPAAEQRYHDRLVRRAQSC